MVAMMTEVTFKLPVDILEKLQAEATRQALPLATVVQAGVMQYLEDDEPTETDILNSIRASLQAALAGDMRSVDEVLAELRQEFDFDADES